MVRLFTFSRSKRSDVKKSRTDIETELPENWESLDLGTPKNRFKRPSEVLKGLNVSLMSKMEELRVLPLSYTFDEIGSFFYDEMEFYNTTETSSLFKHFYLEIVDRSQSLPIILLNKEFILEKILEKYTDKYFQPICSRLLIALVRDCGREIETLFTERIIPHIASTIKVVDVSSVEVGFKVFASALKFLMKDILKNPIYFIKAFLSSMIRIKNAHIRKFTSEAVVFIVSKIRQKDVLNKVATELFGLTLKELNIEDQGDVMVQNFEDFKATLLFMILRGDQGSISEAGVDIKEYIAKLMSSDSLESVFFKKTFNLLIENEYRFFKNREAIEASKVIRSVYLEDYLTEIYEANHKSSRLAVSLLSVLTEILLFGSGQRFTDKLEELSEKLLNKSRTTIAEEGIIFLAKFLVIKKRPHSFFPVFAQMDFDVESIHTFLNNIFRRSSFKRVEIFKEFKKQKLDIHTELETPVLSQSLVESILGALITTLSKSIKDTSTDMYTKSDIAILTCSLLEKNLKDFRFKLDTAVYAIIKSHLFKQNISELVQNTTEDADDNLVYYLSLLRITKFSQNYEADSEFITQASTVLKKLEDAFAKEHTDLDVGSEHIDLGNLEDQDYLRRFDPLSVNYTVYSNLEIKVLLQCELIQSILSNPNASAPAVQTCYDIMESLLSLRDNYTPVIQTLLMVKRAALAVSKRQNKPAVSCVKQNGNAYTFEFGSEQLNLRVFKYLWSEVPESRISCLKLLLTPKSQLYTQLLQLDTTDIAFHKERELFLLCQQISTDVYYGKYSPEETNVLFHFLVGFSSFRISTVQSPLNQALSYVLFRSPAHFAFYQDRVALALLPGRDSTALLATSRIAKLWSGEVDVVQGSLRQLRLLEGLEKVLAEQGKQARFDGERQTHAKGAKLDADGNKEEATDHDMDAAKIQENRDRLTSIFRVLQTLLKTEIAPHILPSLNLLFADNINLVSKGVSKDSDISIVIQMARDTMSNEFENELAKKRRIDALEKLKRIIKGMKSSFTISNFEHRQQLSKYLLEIIKYPNDELQQVSLSTYLKTTKENKIIKQHGQLLIGLTSKDGFKDNLMKMTEKLRTLTDMEREHIIPVLNVILYRRLIDKSGTNNRKRFKAQRDFIFDIAANFSESEMNSLIRTLLLAHGLPLTFTKDTSSVVSDNNRLSLSRLLQFTTLSESLLKRLGSGMKHDALLQFGLRMVECLSLAERGLKHLASEKERIAITVKALKAQKAAEDDDDFEVEANQEEAMAEEPVEQPEDQEEKEAADEDANDQEDRDEDKEAEDADLDLDGAIELTPEDRTTLLMLKYLKQIKQDSFKRIVQLVANFVELDYTEFYANLMPIIKPSISNLGSKTLAKVPTSFKLLGVWSECELYKKYFFEYPSCFEALVAVINNPNSTAAIYIDAFDIIRKVAYFGLSEDNESHFNQSEICQHYLKSTEVKITMKDPLTNEDDTFSSLGVYLVNKYSDPIVESLASLSNSLDKKGLKMIRASDLKNLNKKISEFSLFISTFCTEGSSTAKFYEVTKKAWSVEYINKKTSKPFFKIDSAQELNAVQKEKEIAANMIKILANFCGKIADITQIFTYYFLPMVARLDDLKLRLNLIQCYHKFIENSQFKELGIDKDLLVRLADLHTLAKSLVKVTVDYNKVVDFLIDIGPSFSSMSENEKRLVVANCLYWLTVDEMSTREKSLSVILSYMKEADLNQEAASMDQELAKDQDYSNRAFYKNIILETVIYFYQSHFGREHVMKYFTAVMRGHALKAKHETFSQHLDYTDLSVLVDETNPENDFFELIFNIKLVLRGQAVKVLKKLVKKKGAQFAPSTIKRIFAKIFDYYLYEYWRAANKEENRGSNSRLDSIRHILETVFEVYGILLGQLPFSAFVRFVKDKIFQLDGKGETYAETSVKVICSALNNLTTNLPNVLEKIKAEQAVLNEKALKMSVMNRFLDAYKDQTEISNVRANFDLNLPEKKDGVTLANELAEMKEDENKEIDALLDDEEEEERIEQATLSDSQYRVLKLHILGPLKRYLCKKDEKESNKSSVRPDVAIAIIQIIKLFPNKVFITELIGTLSKICSVLLDRDDERRKTARTTLTNMLKLLGPFFLGYFIKELSFHLKRGYEVHIRNYMIYKLIETVVKPAPGQGEPIKCGQIDYVIPTVAPLLVDEICGDLDEEKEVKEIKTKTVEFRKNKGIESFKLLAQKIDFKGDALTQIMECFKTNFMRYSGLHRMLGKMTDLGNHIISGLMANPTLSTESIVIFVSEHNKQAIKNLETTSVAEDVEIRPGMDMEDTETRMSKLEKTFKIQEGAGQGKSIFNLKAERKIGRKEVFGQFLGIFSLRLFQRCLKLNKVVIKQATQEERRFSSEMIEPIVGQILTFMDSKTNELMHSSLEIISYIISWPIYCVRKNNRKMLRLILRVLETNDVNDLNIIQSCFKMVRRILKANRYFLAPSQITEVLHSIRENLYPADWVNEPLLCLNLLISIRMVKPEIYDIFEDVFGLMVTVRNDGIRKIAKEIVLNFLQNFPLSEQLLERIILRLINNLDFAEADGRLTVMSVFERLFDRLPIEAYKGQLDLIIMAFTARLVNEEVTVVSERCGQIFASLISKINEDKEYQGMLTKMFDNCGVWLRDENEGTKRAGVQLLKTLFWATGDYTKIEETLDDMVTSLNEICSDIETFWDNFKTDEDLKEILKDNQWKDVMIDEDNADPDNPMAAIKETKAIVVDYLHFLDTVICHEKTKASVKSNLLGVLLRLSRHPDEEVQVIILNIVKKVMEKSDNKNVVKEHLKSLLIFLFALLKSRHLRDDISPNTDACFTALFGWFIDEIPKLGNMILTALAKITFKYLRFSNKYMFVTNKCMSVIRSITPHLRTPLSSEDLGHLVGIYVRLIEHGSVRDDKAALDELEAQLQGVSGMASSVDAFMKACTEARAQVEIKKGQYRAQKKQMAVTNPEEFALIKVKDALRKKRRRKEKLMELKFGVPGADSRKIKVV